MSRGVRGLPKNVAMAILVNRCVSETERLSSCHDSTAKRLIIFGGELDKGFMSEFYDYCRMNVYVCLWDILLISKSTLHVFISALQDCVKPCVHLSPKQDRMIEIPFLNFSLVCIINAVI